MSRTHILTAIFCGAIFLVADFPSCAFAQNDSPSATSGSITGHVLRMDNGAPVAKAQVRLLLKSSASSFSTSRTVATGDDGTYKFDGLAPGTYFVEAERDGFLENGYGATHTNDAIDPLALVAGEVLNNIDVRLEATGIISGNVVDQDGAPVKKLPVSAVRVQFWTSGEYVEDVQSAETDDLGNFRILDLKPGNYYVGAGFTVSARGAGNETYGQTFYPGNTTLDGAEGISVGPGSETPGIRLGVAPIESHTINGRYVDSTTHGKVLYTARLLRDAGDSPLSAWPVWTSGPADIRADGSFTIRDVPSGDYVLKVSWRSADPPKPITGPIFVGRENGGSANVKVADADISAVVDISAPTVVKGNLQFEDADRKAFKGMRVSLIPEIAFGSVHQVKLDDAGTFEFQNILPENFVVDVLQPGKMGLYVKDVRCGGGGASVQRMRAEPGTVNQCTVTVADDAGSLSGQVKDVDRVAPDVMLVAIPTRPELRHWPEYLQSSRSDASGNFEFQHLIPADYEVFAVPRANEESPWTPDFVERYHRSAEHVTIEPRSSKTVVLKIASQQ